jgi:hypothetical protein
MLNAPALCCIAPPHGNLTWEYQCSSSQVYFSIAMFLAWRDTVHMLRFMASLEVNKA